MKKIIYLVFMLAIFSIGCKKSVESEQNAWNANKQLINKLSVEYPALKQVLTETLNSAQDAMTKAESISDEKAKIEAMAAANKIANPRYVDQLEDFQDKIKKLKDISTQAIQNAHDENDKIAARKASADADFAISEAKQVLANQTVTSVSEAEVLVNKAVGLIDNATQIVEKIAKVSGDKKQQELDAAEKAKQEQELKEKAEKEAVADIKCEYCASMNKYDASKCLSCGAPIAKK